MRIEDGRLKLSRREFLTFGATTAVGVALVGPEGAKASEGHGIIVGSGFVNQLGITPDQQRLLVTINGAPLGATVPIGFVEQNDGRVITGLRVLPVRDLSGPIPNELNAIYLRQIPITETALQARIVGKKAAVYQGSDNETGGAVTVFQPFGGIAKSRRTSPRGGQR